MKKLILVAIAALLSFAAVAQNVQVSGTVTDAADGSPLIGASIIVKGTQTGASTDVDGKYTMSVPSNAVLQFVYIGYYPIEIPVNGRQTIDVSLTPEAESLEETIVVAYGTAKKGTYTGAASVVKQDAIKDVPSLSFESAMNGKVAGMQITTTSGQAGSAPSIRIRGIGSMNATNEPLYVIDGVPATSGSGQMGDYIYTSNSVMNSINPNDIESITVLKDAAASALYGSRAANGVILVTTKKGKSGKPSVTFRASVGITPSWATDNYEVASTQENIEMLYMVLWDANRGKGVDYTNLSTLSDEKASAASLKSLNSKFNKHGYKITSAGPGVYDKIIVESYNDDAAKAGRTPGNYFDWEDAYFRTGVYQTYDLAVSGGKDNTTYYTSLSYTKDRGRTNTNEFARIAGRVSVNQKVGNWLDFSTNVNLAHTNKVGFNDTRNLGANYYLQTRNLLWGFYYPYDYKTNDPWTARYGSYAYNQVYYADTWDNYSKNLKISVNETINIKFADWLNLRTVFSYDDTRIRDHVYYSADHYNWTGEHGHVTEMLTNYQTLVSSTTLNFNKTFADKHTVGILAGFEAEKNVTDFVRASGDNLPVGSLQTVATAGILDANAYWWGNSIMSILSRAEYNYDNKYYISGSYRRDGSSRLGPDTRWGNFWSVAASWRIDHEDFMKSQDVVSALKLRASYGVNGTLPSSNYGWRSLAAYSYQYLGEPGGALANAADANLSWETSYTANVALEFGFFDDRLRGSVEWFNRDSKDLLQSVPISYITGFSSTLRNVGEINNKGIEFELSGDIIKNSNFRWSAGINGSHIDSKVTSLYGKQDIIWSDPTGGDARAQFIYREGESTLAFYGREWAGVDPENGQNLWFVNEQEGDDPVKEDKMVNGKKAVYDYNDANEVIIGDAHAALFGGFNTDIEWKGLTVGLNFTYKIGGKLYDGAAKDVADDGYYWERTRSKFYYDQMWRADNRTNGTLPRLSGDDWTDAMRCSTRWLYDASYLRLSTVSVGYTLPSDVVKKMHLKNARVYFNGGNLLTFSKYKNADPVVNEYGTRGWETPVGKTYTFGIELSF
ncbi:MAG: TonB-dependent receptor [Bacteroidales bacterium]|nr:TonB-dependent receptor [Bacteroidales bacterium]